MGCPFTSFLTMQASRIQWWPVISMGRMTYPVAHLRRWAASRWRAVGLPHVPHIELGTLKAPATQRSQARAPWPAEPVA